MINLSAGTRVWIAAGIKWDVNRAFSIDGPYDGDDAKFFLDFKVPYTKSNSAGIRCEGKDRKLYSCSVLPVPETGYKTMPAYTIHPEIKRAPPDWPLSLAQRPLRLFYGGSQ